MSVCQGLVMFLVLFGVSCAVKEEIDYQNELECDLDVECPKGWAMYKASATEPSEVGDEGNVDRQWFWDCRKVGNWKYYEYPYEKCRTYTDINSPFELLVFGCPQDYYISGLWSTYLPAGDRVWSVKCCTQPGLCVSDCCLSEESVGEFGEVIHHSAGSDTYFVGLFSYFDAPDFMRDGRRWRFDQCRFDQCSLEYYLKHVNHHHH